MNDEKSFTETTAMEDGFTRSFYSPNAMLDSTGALERNTMRLASLKEEGAKYKI